MPRSLANKPVNARSNMTGHFFVKMTTFCFTGKSKGFIVLPVQRAEKAPKMKISRLDRKDRTMNFRFNQEAFRNTVAYCQERSRGDNHTIIIGIVDRVTRPVEGKIYPYVGKRIEKVTLRPFFTAGYDGFNKKPFSTVIRGDAPVWSVNEWAETKWVEDMIRRNKAIMPDGLPIPVRNYLMIGILNPQYATPKVYEWLSHFYARMILTPGDAAARESVRLLEMARAKENTRLVIPVGLSQMEVAA